MTVKNDYLLNVRIPVPWKRRAEALIEPLSELPIYQAFRLNRSSVMRVAMLRGLEILEAEAANGDDDQ